MAEYVTIAEAARRLGNISDKTIRRAIHAGKLPARYPHPNKAEILVTDLESWYASLSVRPGETENKLKALETQYDKLLILWQETHAAMSNLDLLQENVKFEVTTQLSKFLTILKEQDEQIKKLTARVETLEGQLTKLQMPASAKMKALPKIDTNPPEGFTWLSDFCMLHHVPYQAALDLFPHAIHGQRIGPKRRNYPAIGPKGRHDFWVQLHTRPDFVTCDDCPHQFVESGQSV